MEININNMVRSQYLDILSIEGVKYKGFGIIPKAVMMDLDLSLEAKAIYAYFASYSGAGLSAFPGRDRILSELKIGKERYYKHLKQLTDFGYIKIEQIKDEHNQFSRNLYTLCITPKKYLNLSDNPDYIGIAERGIQDMGYGAIPKAVMTDPRLEIKEKGLYAYYCSFKGEGSSVHPASETVLYHLGISNNTFSKCKRNLAANNLITVKQRHENGHLGICEIYINEKPDMEGFTYLSHDVEVLQYTKNQYTGNQETEEKIDKSPSQYTKNQYTEKQYTRNQYTENKDTIINNITNNSLKNKQSEKENAHEDSDVFSYSSFAGQIDLPMDQYELLKDTFNDFNKLLDKAICALNQRTRKAKSLYHFICEIAINSNWARKEIREENPTVEKISEDERAAQLEDEAEKEIKEKVLAWMKERGYQEEDYGKAREDYFDEISQRIQGLYSDYGVKK